MTKFRLNLRNVAVIFICLTATTMFFSCKDKEKEVNVTSVSLNKTELTLEINKTETLIATVLPVDANNKAVNWSSSNPDVVSVMSNGLVTAIAPGAATITVTTQDGNKTATCEVNVFVKMKTLHDFVVDDIHGNPFDFSQLKGKKVLIVNVASKCGYTPQYAQLQDLYEQYAASNFVVIGFPCNDFGGQEPGTNDEIVDFCQSNYGVTFPLMSKVKVKGTDKAPIYKWLTEKSENEVMNAEIQWNFQKFMIDENGLIVDCILTQAPFYSKIVTWITGN